MKKDNLYKYYTELPQWAKGVVVVGGVGVVGLLGLRIYKKLFPSQSERTAQQLLNTVATDINFGGAATGLISIGAAAGSTNIKSGLVIDGTTTIKSDLSPNVTEVTNLGGSSKRFNNLYLKNSIDFAGSGSITTTGSGKIVLSGIEKTPRGATTASTGAFTTLNVSSDAVCSCSWNLQFTCSV